MNSFIVTLALLGAVAADVKHLNNIYLPPHMAHLASRSHVEYAQQSQEIPQVSLSVDSPSEIVDNSVAADVENHGQEDISVPAPGSDTFVQQQAAYWASVSKQQEVAAVAEPQARQEDAPAPVVEQQPEEPKRQYHTGFIPNPEAAGIAVEEPEQKTEEPEQKPEEPEQKNHAAVKVAPAPALGAASSGIDTQYAADGGYVY